MECFCVPFNQLLLMLTFCLTMVHLSKEEINIGTLLLIGNQVLFEYHKFSTRFFYCSRITLNVVIISPYHFLWSDSFSVSLWFSWPWKFQRILIKSFINSPQFGFLWCLYWSYELWENLPSHDIISRGTYIISTRKVFEHWHLPVWFFSCIFS